MLRYDYNEAQYFILEEADKLLEDLSITFKPRGFNKNEAVLYGLAPVFTYAKRAYFSSASYTSQCKN